MVYSCSAPEQEYTMAWPGILLHLLISSLKIRFCEQSVFAKSPLHWTLGCQKLILYSGTCSPPPGLDSTFPTLNDNVNIQMKRAYDDPTNYNSQPKSF